MSQEMVKNDLILSPKELKDFQNKQITLKLLHVYNNSSFYQKWLNKAGMDIENIYHPDKYFRSIPPVTVEDLLKEKETDQDPFAGTLCIEDWDLYLANRSIFGDDSIVGGLSSNDYELMITSIGQLLLNYGLQKGEISIPGPTRYDNAGTLIMHAHHRIGALLCPIPIPNPSIFVNELINLARGLPVKSIFIDTKTLMDNYERIISIRQVFPDCKNLFIEIAYENRNMDVRKMKEMMDININFYDLRGDQYFCAFGCDKCVSENKIYLHIPENLFFVEILDPKTYEEVLPGNFGLLTMTNLWSDACPYIRYQPGLMASINDEPCPCGNTFKRINIIEKRN